MAKEGQTRFDLGRERFEERVWAHVKETGGAILEQLKAIGASCDWSRTYFTLDDGPLGARCARCSSACTRRASIYRGKYIINWCPRCLTALSNEEAEKEEVDGKIWYLQYPLRGRQRVRHRGHHPPRDDAGRHRRGGASRRQALQGAGRQVAPAAAGGPGDSHRRR